MTALDDRLLPVFARQHWLVTIDDVLAAGGSAAAADRRVALGRWDRIDVAVYRLNGAPITWEGRLLAPLLHLGPPSVASRFAAAALHGIEGFGRGAPEISIPRGWEHRRKHVLVHTSTDLDRCRRVLVSGIPVTDVERTLLDIAQRVSPERLLRAIEWCRREQMTDWPALIVNLQRHARRGRAGVRRFRQVVTANMHRDEVTDSDFELLFLVLLAEAGLPEPVLHHRVFDGRRFVAEVDAAYPAWLIAIELDGAVHLRREVREGDLQKQNDLILLGWTVLRFTWRRFVERPEMVVAEIREAIRAAQLTAAS